MGWVVEFGLPLGAGLDVAVVVVVHVVVVEKFVVRVRAVKKAT